MYLLIDKVKNRIARYYNYKVFLARMGIKTLKDCKVLAKVTITVKPSDCQIGEGFSIGQNVTFRHSGRLSIGNNVKIYSNVTFGGDGDIVIGNNVDIGNDTIIFSSKGGGIKIGDEVAIAAHCYIIDCDHGIDKSKLIREQPLNRKKIAIGHDVWIGDNCTILKGSIINQGAVIGAKSLVNKEIDEYAIAVGIPAKVIKYRQ